MCGTKDSLRVGTKIFLLANSTTLPKRLCRGQDSRPPTRAVRRTFGEQKRDGPGSMGGTSMRLTVGCGKAIIQVLGYHHKRRLFQPFDLFCNSSFRMSETGFPRPRYTHPREIHHITDTNGFGLVRLCMDRDSSLSWAKGIAFVLG